MRLDVLSHEVVQGSLAAVEGDRIVADTGGAGPDFPCDLPCDLPCDFPGEGAEPLTEETPMEEELEPESKCCNSCGRDLPEDDFPHDERNADARCGVCRQCYRMRNQAWEAKPEVRVARNAKRRQRGPEYRAREVRRVQEWRRRKRAA